jgi:hypothetical protein
MKNISFASLHCVQEYNYRHNYDKKNYLCLIIFLIIDSMSFVLLLIYLFL